jgi:3-methyladenine DNA glycosylase AlkC
MSNLLKDIYTPRFFDRFANVLNEVIRAFDKERFIKLIFDKHWKHLELKQRMKHIAVVLNQFLPADFDKAAKLIPTIIRKLKEVGFTESGIEFMFLPEYIETYGIDRFDTAVKTIESVTQFISCEFAVRPFIIKYSDKMINEMIRWSMHDNSKVRRLASEGCRPRLPWAMALPALKKNPTPILPILENLKSDPSESVRRSVANNINDIAKDNPQVVISLAQRWKGLGPETDAIIKHGCRTLLKNGHSQILEYFELASGNELEVTKVKLGNSKVKIGGVLEFSFALHNRNSTPKKVRIEYAIFYLRKNSVHSRKVFKISERHLTANEKLHIARKQSFKLITTRKFYSGIQRLAIIINGQEKVVRNFRLTDATV